MHQLLQQPAPHANLEATLVQAGLQLVSRVRVVLMHLLVEPPPV